MTSWIVLILSLAFSSQAKIYTGINFSDEEKKLHLERLDTITETAASCLERVYADHYDFFEKNNVTKYFGNRKYIKGWNYVVKNGRRLTPILPELEKRNLDLKLQDEMEHISCIDLARKCLEEGFNAADLNDQWNKIDKFIPEKIGNRLQHALQELGWKMLYWNPNPSKNQEWDAEDKAIAPGNPLYVWGYHESRYRSVMNNDTYLYNKVDDKKTLVGFGTNPPEFLKDTPIAIGTAHSGYHVFPVTYGETIEAHSTRSLFSIDNLEYSPFNPLEEGGGPRWTRTERYRSGLLVVPPNSK